MYESIDVSYDCNEDIPCGHNVFTVGYKGNLTATFVPTDGL